MTFEVPLSTEDVQRGVLSVYVCVNAGHHPVRLAEQHLSIAELLLSNPYTAERERTQVVALSPTQTQLKVDGRWRVRFVREHPLPDWSSSSPACDQVHVQRGVHLIACDTNGKSDPYCVMTGVLKNHDKVEKYTTSVCSETLDPVWNDPAVYFATRQWNVEDYDHIQIEIFDRDRLSKDDPMGMVQIPAANFWQAESTLVCNMSWDGLCPKFVAAFVVRLVGWYWVGLVRWYWVV